MKHNLGSDYFAERAYSTTNFPAHIYGRSVRAQKKLGAKLQNLTQGTHQTLQTSFLAVWSRAKCAFFSVQQQSQFPTDKIKWEQEVKPDQTWLLEIHSDARCKLLSVSTRVSRLVLDISGHKTLRWEGDCHGPDRVGCLWSLSQSH